MLAICLVFHHSNSSSKFLRTMKNANSYHISSSKTIHSMNDVLCLAAKPLILNRYVATTLFQEKGNVCCLITNLSYHFGGKIL